MKKTTKYYIIKYISRKPNEQWASYQECVKALNRDDAIQVVRKMNSSACEFIVLGADLVNPKNGIATKK